MKDGKQTNKLDIEEIAEAGKRFLAYCEKFGWGTLEVKVKDGQPVMISPIKQDIKLD